MPNDTRGQSATLGDLLVDFPNVFLLDVPFDTPTRGPWTLAIFHKISKIGVLVEGLILSQNPLDCS